VQVGRSPFPTPIDETHLGISEGDEPEGDEPDEVEEFQGFAEAAYAPAPAGYDGGFERMNFEEISLDSLDEVA
jgi:hypothetical protein